VTDQSYTPDPKLELSVIGCQHCARSECDIADMYDTRQTYAINVPDVRNESRLHRCATWTQRSGPAFNLRQSISSSSDFAVLEKLDLPKIGTKLVHESR
jgi:hypothetical protein